MFSSWFWGLDALDRTDTFQPTGASFGSIFLGAESTPGQKTQVLLFGLSPGLEAGFFQAVGKEARFSIVNLSENEMLAMVAGAEAVFTVFGLQVAGGASRGGNPLWGLAAAIVDAAAVATWVKLTYGKK